MKSPADAIAEAEAPRDHVQNLSFHDIWMEFRRRKFAYQKRYKKRPTGVVVGKLEGGIFAQFKEELARRKMIRMDGRHLFINNMLVIIGAQESCIAPFHIEVSQLDEENPYANI